MTLSFSLVKKELPVTLETASGSKTIYLRELSGKDRDAYLKILGAKMRFDDEGKPQGLKSFDGLHIPLVSLSLYSEDGKRVPTSEIEEYPAAVVEALFDAAQDLSAINKATTTESGNG
jgi:hypothetical protein